MVKRLLQVLGGEAGSPPPVWLMRQAGRYLPEYRALRANAPDFVRFCLSPELAVEVTLQPVERFKLDAAILFADILLIPHALGQKLWFAEGEGPRLDPIRDEAGIAALAYDAEKLNPVMQTIKGVRAALPPQVALIGWAGAPWTVAPYMIEGRSSDRSDLRWADISCSILCDNLACSRRAAPKARTSPILLTTSVRSPLTAAARPAKRSCR